MDKVDTPNNQQNEMGNRAIDVSARKGNTLIEHKGNTLSIKGEVHQTYFQKLIWHFHWGKLS